jgi:predicted Zn-dependent protease
MKSRFHQSVVVLVCLVIPLVGQADEKALADMEREAKQVLSDPDNVAQRKRIGPVFAFAERCAATGRTNEALKYYGEALERQPWNLDAQLAVARLLDGAGNTSGARQKAELVLKYAETDGLLAGAASLLGQPFSTNLEQEALPTAACALALVPYGGPDAWVMKELRDDLGKTLGIPVVIRQAKLEVQKPKRDPLHLRGEELRERIAKARKDPQFDLQYRRLKLNTNSLADDEQVFVVAEAVMEADRTSQEQARVFREELAFLRRLGPQWDANEIIRQLGKGLNVRPGSGMGYLGVTKLDVYANESRYVFGLAAVGGNAGIVSYRRYTADLLDEPPNRDRLKERLLKQALSTIGLMYGLSRCTDPTCARAYANSLAEHDAKQLKLCAECQQGFAKRFGRKSQ